jgi:hypothetical protein
VVAERWRSYSISESIASHRDVPTDEPIPLLTAWDNQIRSEAIASMIDRSDKGLRDGHQPVALSDGMAGVYLLVDSNRQRVGIFKPSNEEVGCDQNPKGNTPNESVNNVRSGLEPGQSMFREVAASILDHNNFAGVPGTCLVKCAANGSPKLGSLQAFVESNGSSGDLGHSRFQTLDVQKIAMLDIRLLNLDRHDGNILYSMHEGLVSLIPIDHGCCLPRRFEVCNFEWCWMDWPQVKAEVHPDVKAYVASLDAERDIALLKKFNIPLSNESLRVFRTMTRLLKQGVAAGLTLFEIASIASRDMESERSRLERVVVKAKWLTAVECLTTGHKFSEVLTNHLNKAVDNLVQVTASAQTIPPSHSS